MLPTIISLCSLSPSSLHLSPRDVRAVEFELATRGALALDATEIAGPLPLGAVFRLHGVPVFAAVDLEPGTVRVTGAGHWVDAPPFDGWTPQVATVRDFAAPIVDVTYTRGTETLRVVFA